MNKFEILNMIDEKSTTFLQGVCEDLGDALKEDILLEKDFTDRHTFFQHYDRHVCKQDEPYTGKVDSSGIRIKFPHMEPPTYQYNANRFLFVNCPGSSKDSVDSKGCIGWKTHLGWFKGDVYVKFRKCPLPEVKKDGLIEYICYIPIKGDEDIKQEIPGGSYTRKKVINRKIVSYGLCVDIPQKCFPIDGELPSNERDLTESMLKELYHWHRLEKNYLTEANRQQLLQKSRNAQHYKDVSKGKNRYERRMKSRISATVRDYNNIQMDPLFKRDILEIKIPVMGETDVYEVDVRVDGLLSEIQKQIHSNKGILEFKVILQSLMKVLNVGDVYIGCNCPDAKYRHAYNQTKNGYKAGYRETRPSNITNPGDTLGAGCKHVMLILANLDWCVKVSSVINNYIKYCQENLEQAYADYIFPKIYGIKYDKAVQMNLFYNGMLPDDKKTMDEITQRSLQGRDNQGKFKKNNPFAFQKKETEEPQEDNGQLNLNLEEPVQKELKMDIEEPDNNEGTEGNI